MNKVILMGRLTRDPEVRYSQGGENSLVIARYTLAVDRLIWLPVALPEMQSVAWRSLEREPGSSDTSPMWFSRTTDNRIKKSIL